MVNVFFPEYSDNSRQAFVQLRVLRHPKVKLWVSKDFLNNIKALSVANDVKIIERGETIDRNVRCIEWNINNHVGIPQQDAFHFLVKHSNKSECEWIVFSDGQHPKGTLALFVDAPHVQQLPDKWNKYRCVNSYDILMSTLKDGEYLPFALYNGPDFQKTSTNVKGAEVYQQKTTGYYWHLDTLHKNHYEVYDKLKKHIGEADIQTGKINTNKKDSNKSL